MKDNTKITSENLYELNNSNFNDIKMTKEDIIYVCILRLIE